MPEYKVIDMIDGEPTFELPLSEILAKCKVGGCIKVLSPLDYHTDQQRKWWKGILLPALSKDNGNTVHQWQTDLVKAIFPGDVEQDGYGNDIYPSISGYGKRKMNTLINESVAQLHDWGFKWVTLPDKELRT